MRYENVVSGKFIARPNRFIAEIEIDGKTEICHVMNTGRMKELLVPGAKVFLTESKNPVRKTKYDLVAVENEGRTVNIDSLAPNKVAGEYIKKLFPKVTFVRPETVFGNSREKTTCLLSAKTAAGKPPFPETMTNCMTCCAMKETTARSCGSWGPLSPLTAMPARL